MILSDKDILRAIEAGRIRLIPQLQLRNLRPTGIRFHLAAEILVPTPGQAVEIDTSGQLNYDAINIGDQGYVLRPGHFVLASSIEMVGLARDLVCWIETRSTIARMGMTIHMGSAIFDNVHEEVRAVTLELFNAGPVRLMLKAGAPVGMFVFCNLTGEIQQGAHDQYRNQRGVTAPRP